MKRLILLFAISLYLCIGCATTKYVSNNFFIDFFENDKLIQHFVFTLDNNQVRKIYHQSVNGKFEETYSFRKLDNNRMDIEQKWQERSYILHCDFDKNIIWLNNDSEHPLENTKNVFILAILITTPDEYKESFNILYDRVKNDIFFETSLDKYKSIDKLIASYNKNKIIKIKNEKGIDYKIIYNMPNVIFNP
jgi:hypothetical protein